MVDKDGFAAIEVVGTTVTLAFAVAAVQEPGGSFVINVKLIGPV
jgi:hypothetical protein